MHLDNLAESIRKVQEISRTELCTVHIGIRKERYFSTFRLPDGGSAERIATNDDGRIFAGASLFKVFIAAGTSLMIEKLSVSSDPANRFRGLRNAWSRTFTDVLNEFSQGFKIKPLYGNPTVFDLLVHYKGPCDINHLLLAPGPLLSKDEFLSTISQYAEDTRKRHNDTAWCDYSNANYILIALLIEVVSEKSLADFLREYIFEPLGMHRTYMTAEELSSVPIGQRVQPHLVSSNGLRRALPFNEIPYLSDTVEIAAMGGYTCAAGVGKFFEMVLEGLYGIPSSPNFDKDFVTSLFRGVGKLDEGDHGYTRFGLYTTLDGDLPGSHSLNRLILSDSDSSDSSAYKLGKNSQNKEVEAYYMAGSATGWLSTAYFLPKQQVFIIVLTNTSGPLDLSDIVSRLCLQEILDLRPSKIRDLNFKCRPKGWKSMTSSEVYRAHYVELASRMYEENALGYKKLEEEDNASDTPTIGCANALGTYLNRKSGQFLKVIDLDGILGVSLKGESKESKPMRFVRKGQVFRICSRSRGTTDLAIDCFGDWRTLEFGFEEDNGIVVCFFREGCNLVDRFTRI